MSVSVLGNAQRDSLVSTEEVVQLAKTNNLTIPESELADWAALLAGLNHCAKEILEIPDYYPAVDTNLYPRTEIHRPEGLVETDCGGWAWKGTVKSTKPTSNELQGKTLAIKDNIAVAAIKCTNGTGAVDWTPDVDATLVTRILDAGGVITGKAACENNCFGAVSDTSVTGPVHNPYAHGYSTGGSSSGSGRLLASGQVDMTIGADQGGSIRLPSANCGVVGLKPTWGLVPYTGCISLEATIDHVGPMCKTVQDCATLLEVIAGSDGIDDRQPYNWPQGHIKFGQEIASHLSSTKSSSATLKGMKIGILREGFEDPMTDSNVATASRAAIKKLGELGAEVKEISIPLHRDSGMIWMVALPMAGTTQGLLANPAGRKQLLFPTRSQQVGSVLSQAAFDALGPGGQNIYLRGLFLQQQFGSPLHARCTNLLRKLNDEYDRALRDVDVLVMPTIIFPPVKICPEGGRTLGPLPMLSRTIGATYNTATFNSSGHPGLSLPVGFVNARDDENVWLPTGLQIVGRKFEDLTCLKVAASYEQRNNWKELKYGGGSK
ncbi:Amidase signature (AS) enzyme [Glarea lozoyensis ATCC 20868]|uniref:Amidase signature (AS) enzyme n=1 Tax=Glarea lozoyensis (strain ATCC 20868 / MF5171) TaxID=1116229 RepID=S3DDL6_GLAL2|nr:Amidase signature (AS) enzyme [Glarea lozoyensis ATCC 20868]EPE30081.1 Amidase signature (AS) enzyme [Glarea lozoyensis ATCC 20868]